MYLFNTIMKPIWIILRSKELKPTTVKYLCHRVKQLFLTNRRKSALIFTHIHFLNLHLNLKCNISRGNCVANFKTLIIYLVYNSISNISRFINNGDSFRYFYYWQNYQKMSSALSKALEIFLLSSFMFF